MLTFSSVIIVIVEVVGFVHLIFGFSVDLVTTVFLIISLGLSVDYRCALVILVCTDGQSP